MTKMTHTGGLGKSLLLVYWFTMSVIDRVLIKHQSY